MLSNTTRNPCGSTRPSVAAQLPYLAGHGRFPLRSCAQTVRLISVYNKKIGKCGTCNAWDVSKIQFQSQKNLLIAVDYSHLKDPKTRGHKSINALKKSSEPNAALTGRNSSFLQSLCGRFGLQGPSSSAKLSVLKVLESIQNPAIRLATGDFAVVQYPVCGQS